MSAPARKTTAAKTPANASPANVAAAKAVFDFSSIQAADATMPTGTRGSQLDGTPFRQWIKDSYSANTAKAFVVPQSVEKQSLYLIRAAAREAGYGVRVVSQDAGNGNVRISFLAKSKKNVQPKRPTTARKNETPEKLAARQAAWDRQYGQQNTPAPSAS